jgi:serine/threonine protein kinase
MPDHPSTQAVPEPATAAVPALPRKLGKYELKEVLGRGATSTVYLADDPFLVREVAIKVVHRKGAGEAGLAETHDPGAESLRTEAMLLGRINHPHIVKVYDVVRDAGEHYVVMELVRGGSVEKHCRRGNLLDYPKVLDAIFKCAKALQYMNALGMIHRDIKPANILLTETEDVRLSDLGATLLSEEGGQLDARVGTPFYMSPEQLLGRALDFRSDMFALGIVFYELLTGEKPFDALNVDELIFQYAQKKPRAPSTMRPILPPDVDAVVARMLGALPSERYASWDECLEALFSVPTRRDEFDSSGFSSASERFRLLRESPFFAGFSDADLWYVVEIGLFHRIFEGDVLIREDTPGGFFLVILKGSVRVTKAERFIAEVTAGQSIGEISYVLEGRVPRNTTCTALANGIALRVEDEVLRNASAICRSRFEKTFLQMMANWLVTTDSRLVSPG